MTRYIAAPNTCQMQTLQPNVNYIAFVAGMYTKQNEIHS